MPVDEIMTQSPSQTVSIYEALAEILSKPTESLNFSNSKSTDRTLMSEAPISSTTTSTTSTTTTTTTPPPPTTEANDEFKVENSTLDGPKLSHSVNTRVNNREVSTEAPAVPSITDFPVIEPSQLTEITQIDNSNLTTTEAALNNFQVDATTAKEEFSTDTTTTTPIGTVLTQSSTEHENYLTTNNLTKFDNETNATTKTEIETTKTNLKLDRMRSNLKRLMANAPNNIIRKNFMKSLTTSTVPPNYSPRFSPSNRIPILAFGSFREDRKIDSTTKLAKVDLMTNKITKSGDEILSQSTPSVFPIYRPEIDITTVRSTFPYNTSSSTGAFNVRDENSSTKSSNLEAFQDESLSIESSTVGTIENEKEFDTTSSFTSETFVTDTAISSTEAFTPKTLEVINEFSSTSVTEVEISSTESLTFVTNSKLHEAFTSRTFENEFPSTSRSSTSEVSKHENEFLTTKSFVETTQRGISSTESSTFSDVENSKEYATVTEMFVTSSLMTLTAEETTAIPNNEEVIDFSSTARVNGKEIDSISSTASDFTTLSQSLINEINELTTVTETPTITSTETFDTNPRSIECRSFPCSTKPATSIESPIKVKHPKSLFPPPSHTSHHTEKPKAPKGKERIVYAILPNNTVIRKIIFHRLTTENPHVIYGIFPNHSVVRKFRNGTILPDESTARIEITNIDPKSLRNPNSDFHQRATESVLQKPTVASTTNLPITDHTKTVFYLLISIICGSVALDSHAHAWQTCFGHLSRFHRLITAFSLTIDSECRT